MISSFSLKIDGKKINIPKRFWNDLVGLDLYKVIINKKSLRQRKNENSRNLLKAYVTLKFPALVMAAPFSSHGSDLKNVVALQPSDGLSVKVEIYCAIVKSLLMTDSLYS